MNNVELIKNIMNYIDENIEKNMTAQELAERSGYSFYHFCHLFKALTGQSIGAYLRSRRIELASEDILSGQSITEVAMNRGFDTPSGFAKAFRKYYGLSPKEYKFMKGGYSMIAPEIKSLPSFTAIGYCLAPPKSGFNILDYGAYWLGQDFSSVSKEDYKKLSVLNKGEVGMWMHPDKVSGEFYYFFGPIVKDKEFIPEGMEILEVPTAEYAIFLVERATSTEKVNANVREMWNCIFAEWVDSSEYKLDEVKMSFEYYLEEEAYIYIPVVKKLRDDIGRRF